MSARQQAVVRSVLGLEFATVMCPCKGTGFTNAITYFEPGPQEPYMDIFRYRVGTIELSSVVWS
jgi:hypothetical protein